MARLTCPLCVSTSPRLTSAPIESPSAAARLRTPQWHLNSCPPRSTLGPTQCKLRTRWPLLRDLRQQTRQSFREVALLRDLRDRFEQRIAGGRIVSHHLAPILIRVELRAFVSGASALAEIGLPLYQMICHHGMNDILRPPLRHVAGNAVRPAAVCHRLEAPAWQLPQTRCSARPPARRAEHRADRGTSCRSVSRRSAGSTGTSAAGTRNGRSRNRPRTYCPARDRRRS